MNPEPKRVVIIGAGPGGLATAMLLAKAGLNVTLVESREKVGGRTSILEQEGFSFDVGPTFFLYPKVLKEIFATCGYDLDREVALTRLDPQYRLVFGAGGELLATPDAARMEAEIRAISPMDAVRFRGFVLRNRAKLEGFVPFLQRPFTSWRDLCCIEVLKALPLVAPWKTLDEDLREHFADERIRLGFSFQSKYLGMSPYRCPSLFSILSFLEYEHGVYHPKGGCGAVTQAMERIARKLGATILLNEPVTGILSKEGRATGVKTEVRTLAADAVVVNADFAKAMQHLLPNRQRKKWSDEKIVSKEFSCSTFMMYLGIEGLYERISHHTIYLAKDYRTNLHDIDKAHRLSNDPSFYVQNAGVTDSTLAPSGHSTLYVLFPVTHRSDGVDWVSEKERFRTLAIQQLEKIGITDLESRIRTETVITPAGWESEFGLHKGATFSMAHTMRQMFHLRPHNRFEDLKHTYLVGGGTHPGSGLPIIFESARISSRLLLSDLGVHADWTDSHPEVAAAKDFFQTDAFGHRKGT